MNGAVCCPGPSVNSSAATPRTPSPEVLPAHRPCAEKLPSLAGLSPGPAGYRRTSSPETSCSFTFVHRIRVVKTDGLWFWALCLCTLLAVGCKKKTDIGRPSGGAATDAPAKLRVAVIPKGTTHEFWKAVHAGAEKAAREVNVEVIWKGPL